MNHLDQKITVSMKFNKKVGMQQFFSKILPFHSLNGKDIRNLNNITTKNMNFRPDYLNNLFKYPVNDISIDCEHDEYEFSSNNEYCSAENFDHNLLIISDDSIIKLPVSTEY